MEKYIAKIGKKIQEAKTKGEKSVFVSFASGIFANNKENQKCLECAFDGLGYSFSWQEAYDNYGVSWATWLHIKW